jgi:hypothetical protein
VIAEALLDHAGHAEAERLEAVGADRADPLTSSTSSAPLS